MCEKGSPKVIFISFLYIEHKSIKFICLWHKFTFQTHSIFQHPVLTLHHMILPWFSTKQKQVNE